VRFRLIPREERFFADFVAFAEELGGAARLLEDMLAGEQPRWDTADEVKEIEHRCDLMTHEIIQRLNRTFVTPIDREDIHALSTRLDDVIDLIDGTARRAEIFNIGKQVRPAAQELTRLIVEAAEHLQRGVKGIKRTRDVNACAVEVKRIEEEGDAVYHDAVGALFVGSPDPLDVMKWKEIYDRLEQAIDSCMSVVHALQSISMKNA
jgi:hypothetical protein